MTLIRALYATTRDTLRTCVYYSARNLADWLETLSHHDDEPVGEQRGTTWVAKR